jgi:hypothetical protein
MGEGTVYVIQAGAYFKIGRTRNLTQRLVGLRTGSPAPLTVIYQLETPESDGLERWLHRRFAEARLQSEWYQLTPEQLAAIQVIQLWPPPSSLTEAEQLSLLTLTRMTLQTLLRQHGITKIKELRERTGL